MSRYSQSDDDDVESVTSERTVDSRFTTRTDISYQTAGKRADDKLRKMETVERKDRVVGLGRGRAIPAQNLQLGIGRGRIGRN